jgi:hypothetical protein
MQKLHYEFGRVRVGHRNVSLIYYCVNVFLKVDFIYILNGKKQ